MVYSIGSLRVKRASSQTVDYVHPAEKIGHFFKLSETDFLDLLGEGAEA